MHDWGHTISQVDAERGLRELNPGFHFDMGVKLGLGESASGIHPMQDIRQGVYFQGRHVCSMDRGVIPEFKLWSMVDRVVPVSLGDADMAGASVQYSTITPDTPGYEDLYQDALANRRDDLMVRADGKLCAIRAVRTMKVRGRVMRVGWRHTFERIILSGIHGCGREDVAEKFKVNMYKVPVGGPLETWAAFVEE